MFLEVSCYLWCCTNRIRFWDKIQYGWLWINCLLFIFYMKMIIVNVSRLIGRIKRGFLLKAYSFKGSLPLPLPDALDSLPFYSQIHNQSLSFTHTSLIIFVALYYEYLLCVHTHSTRHLPKSEDLYSNCSSCYQAFSRRLNTWIWAQKIEQFF